MILVLHLSIPYVSFDRHSVFETKEYLCVRSLGVPTQTTTDSIFAVLTSAGPSTDASCRRPAGRTSCLPASATLPFNHIQNSSPACVVSDRFCPGGILTRIASSWRPSDTFVSRANRFAESANPKKRSCSPRQTERSSLGVSTKYCTVTPSACATGQRCQRRRRGRVRLETETASKSRGGSGVVERALESLAQRANLAQRGSICSPRVFSGEP